MVGKTISHYKILEKLGEGGMGVVYKAEDTKLKRTVALKFLSAQAVGSEEDKKRFVREAQAAAALDHQNICTVYEIEEAEGQTFIAMAYLDGQSLKDKIETRPLKLDEALDIAMQVAQGLHEAHENGIVHRDIKSSNIMMTTKGQAKIMDFGLARQAGKTMITKEGTSMGTVAYMSPEQAQGATVDHRTDIWSFGVMLYEMVTGQLPFKGDYEQAVVYSIMNEDPEPMTALRTGVPMELERIVNKAMAKNPAERYQNVNDLLIDLRSVVKELEAGTSKTRLTTAARPGQEVSVSLFKDLLQRRVPQIVGIYFAASWTVIQVVEWLVDRYVLSTHLPDFSLVVLLSMIPTVSLLAYFHGRPGRDKWTKMEKIGIPVNMVVSVALLFVIFYGKDLGAAQTTITVQDEEGNKIERVIPKSEFRKKFALFFFENESGDSTLKWLQYAIPGMLGYDLSQDIFLDIKLGYQFYNKMKEAGFSKGIGLPLTLKNKIADDLHMKHFVSGSFTKQNEELSVKTSIYETKRGKLITESIFKGRDIFKLVDEMSVQLKRDLEIPERHIEEVKDLPVSEIFTNSLAALELYITGENAIVFDQDWKESLEYFERSVQEDPTFALAYFELQAVYLVSNQSEKIAPVIPSLMRHLYKLPERVQLSVKYFYYYLIKQDADKGFNVVKMWVDLYPDDIEAHAALASIYENRNQQDEAVLEYRQILQLDPEQHNYLQKIGSIYKDKGEFEEALKYYEQYAEKFPNKYESFTAISGLYKTLGDYEQAKFYCEKALVIEPEKISVLRQLAKIESNLGHFEQAIEQYQEALKISKIPKDSAAVYSSLRSLYTLRGQLGKAVDYMHLAWAEGEKFQPPVQGLFKKLNGLSTYIKAGNEDLAFQTIDAIKAKLAPPWDKFLPLGYLNIFLELEDADHAEKALEGVEVFIHTWQIEAFRSHVLYAEGKIHEIRGEHEQAILSYQKELELDPTDASINRRIGRCYRELREFKKAEEFIQKNLTIEPFNPKAHYELALVYFEMDKKEMALEHLKKALYVWEEADPEYKPAKKAREKLAEWEALI